MEKYISDLLYQHECVIVPGFGAFISNYNAARINPTEDEIAPPSRSLAFNSSLKTNDGLLSHHFASQEKLSFTDALKEISQQVQKWNAILESGQSLPIDKVGDLMMNEDHKIDFTPDVRYNYHVESYGFEPVAIQKVDRDRIKPPVEEVVHEVQEILEEQMTSGRYEIKSISKRNNKKILLYSLTAYAPILILLWVFFLVKEPFIDQNQSSILPFEQQVKVDKQPELDNQEEKVVLDVKEEVSSKPEAVSVQDKNDNTVEVVEEESRVVTNKSGFYYVIGGSFLDLERAEVLQNQFLAKEFDSYIVISLDGKHRVSYFRSRNYETCLSELSRIKASENRSAWILKQ